MIHRLQRIVQEVNRASDIDHALVLITESLTLDLKADACTIFLATLATKCATRSVSGGHKCAW